MSIINDSGHLVLENKYLTPLSKTLEYAFRKQIIDKIKFEYKKKGLKRIQEYLPNDDIYKDGKYVTLPNYSKEEYKFRKQIIEYNTIMSPTLKEIVKEVFDVDDATFHANWLTSYAYEFFFISMEKNEINFFPDAKLELLSTNNMEYIENNLKTYYVSTAETGLFSVSGLEKMRKPLINLDSSFVSLKKGFFLLSAQISPAIISLDYQTSINLIDDNDYLEFNAEIDHAFYKILESEGFESISYKDYKNCYMSTLFFILFSDTAYKILEGEKYKNISEHFTTIDTNKNLLLSFLLEDFMPEIIKKINSLLSDYSKSGLGYYLYKMVSENNKEYGKDFFILNFQNWKEWYDQVLNNSKIYNKWVSDLKHGEYDFMANSMNKDQLFAGFTDVRGKNK